MGRQETFFDFWGWVRAESRLRQLSETPVIATLFG
jgi:hypothetical protein